MDKAVKGVLLTPLKQVFHPKGDIYHAMKKSDAGFNEFGEAYFSTIHKSDIKSWKKHTQMTLNLVVPVGEIEFVIYDGTDFFSTKLSQTNYQRLTVSPNLWVAFRGVQETNMLLNLASMEHDPSEVLHLALDEIPYAW